MLEVKEKIFFNAVPLHECLLSEGENRVSITVIVSLNFSCGGRATVKCPLKEVVK